MPTEPIPTIGYIRVSMAREEMISPELQQTAITNWAARSGRRIVRWIIDLDQTGRNFKRRVMDAILAVEAGEVREIAVWKYSRFGRNRLGWAINLDRVESAGGALQSATEEIDARTATGKLARGVLAEIAAFQSDAIGEGWQEVHARRLEAGLPANGKPRWGYTYSRADGFVPDSVFGPILAGLYRRYTVGESAERLVEWLNAQGITTTTGGTFEARTLLRMLDTGFAAGKLRRHKPDATCHKKSGHCANDVHMELLSGAHRPVITPAEWVAYRAARKARAQIPPRTRGSTYPFSGLVRCARCIGPMHPGQYGARHEPKYRCANRAKRGPSVCRGGYVMARLLEDAFREWLTELVADADRLSTVTQPTVAHRAVQFDATRLARQIERLDEALTRLTVDRAVNPNLIPEDAYIAARDRITVERDELADKLGALDAERDRPRPGPEVYRGLLTEWDTLPADRRRDMCRQVLARIEVRPGRPRADITIVPHWEG